MPKLYVSPNPQPNAFATGRNPENAAVAVTEGLLRSMSRGEVAGVVAHELAHIKNRDTLTMTITATLAGAISMLAQFGLFFGGGGDRERNPLGIIGVIIFWQMFYGVVVYFFQFFNNGRHKGHRVKDIVLFVGVSNAAWAIFPLIGLWASIQLILDGNYSVFF